MKQGRSLQELAAELERQAELKQDYIADTRHLHLGTDGDLLFVEQDIFVPTPLCHRQVGERVGIPAKYYDRMKTEAPELLAQNVNHWFQFKPENRMVRTMDGEARAFLSSQYRRLDNYDLMEAVLPVLAEIPDLQVSSCEVTENRLYVKCVTKRMEAEIKKGDPVQAGLVVSNSEVGLGAFSVEPMLYILKCSNGLIAPAYGMRKHHVGRKIDAEESARELFSDEAMQADDRAFWLKARDIIKGALSQDLFERLVNEMQQAGQQRIQGHPAKAVEQLANKMQLTQKEEGGILQHLIEGADLSMLGMSQAVTRTSQDIDSYDRATELERMGHQIITLERKEWEEIATAA